MLRLARFILVLAVTFGSSASGALNGRVLCLGDRGHFAIESPHPCGDCAASHDQDDGPAEGDSSGPHGKCVDVSSDVDLVRESASRPLKLQHAQVLLPHIVEEPLRFIATPAGGTASVRPFQHPPAPGELARLGDIVLTI